MFASLVKVTFTPRCLGPVRALSGLSSFLHLRTGVRGVGDGSPGMGGGAGRDPALASASTFCHLSAGLLPVGIHPSECILAGRPSGSELNDAHILKRHFPD